MTATEDAIAFFLCRHIERYLPFMGSHWPQRPTLAMVRDLAMAGIVCSKAAVLDALTRIRNSGAVEVSFGSPHYLLPWTNKCVACDHQLDSDGHSDPLEVRGGRIGEPQKVVLVRGRCGQCNIGYQFYSGVI